MNIQDGRKGIKMNVYQIRIKIFLLKNISVDEMQTRTTYFIDKMLIEHDEFQKWHGERTYKGYCFDMPYPIPQDKVYKAQEVYTLTVRTIQPKLAQLLEEKAGKNDTREIKGLVTEMTVIPKGKHIEQIYSLTPVVLKEVGGEKNGYWRSHITFEQYEQLIQSNLYKKWKIFTGRDIQEDELFQTISFINRKPISVPYKNIHLLCDKLCIHIQNTKIAQEIAYLSLGTGIGENNGRGFGFVNYRWL